MEAGRLETRAQQVFENSLYRQEGSLKGTSQQGRKEIRDVSHLQLVSVYSGSSF